MADLLEVPVESMQRVIEAAGQGKADDSRIRALLEAARKGEITDVAPVRAKGASATKSEAKNKTPDLDATSEPKSARMTHSAPQTAASAPPANDADAASPRTEREAASVPSLSFIDEAHDDETLMAHLEDPVALFAAQLGRFCERFSLQDLLRIDAQLPYHFWMEWPETNMPLEALDTDNAPGAQRALAYLVLVSLSGQLDSDVATLLPTESRWAERLNAGSFDHPDGPFDLQYQHVLSGVVGDNGGAFGMSWRAWHALMATPVLWGWVEMLTQTYHGLLNVLDAASADAAQRD